VLILERPIGVEQLRESIAARLDHAPELSLRLQERDGEQWWMRDRRLDLRLHVVEHDGPPLDRDGLRVAIAHLFEARLDRDGPLWQIDVLPPLAGGGSALVWRIHHALADGTTAMRIGRNAIWNEPDADAKPNRRSGARAGDSPAYRDVQGLHMLVREAPHGWLRSPFDGQIDSKRSVAFASGDLGSFHRVAAEVCGATVNDAVLTVVSGGLRRWLEAAHCEVGPVRVKVPVSLHGAQHGDAGEDLGNRDSYFCLDLPLGPADPAARLEAIHRATKARKQDHDAEWLDAVMRELGKASPGLRRFADQVLASPRSFALNVSNVPGPRRPIDVLGAPVDALYAIAEIGERHALRIAVLSLADTLSFGLCADPTLLPDVEQLAVAIEDEAAALCALTAPM
jgi:WS/DGAT C-terminal domain/Wax ester synthase/diacylglycerol acyltransferase catalytic domain